MKDYKTSLTIIICFLIVFAFNMLGSKSKHGKKYSPKFGFVITDTSILSNVHDVDVNNPFSDIDNFDIPLPLTNVSEQILYRKNYIVSYNKDYRIPNWVAWHLTAEHTFGDVKRPGNAWHEDLDVPAPRANNMDYKRSGWTRGHMCPAGDNKWDSDAMYETFLYSNCCPQNAKLNTSTWNQIEISSRRWAELYGDLYIVCGPILFRQEHEIIGENKIVVPEAFFKIILCLNGDIPKGIGFVCRNTDGNRKKDLYVNSIKQVERITGITFFPHLSNEVSEKVKNDANIDDWE